MEESRPLSSLGAYLRGLREAKGVSLEEIARSTRIGLRHLQALEADNFAELPAPVFVKGFIRAYCEFLNEPADEVLARYRAALGEGVPGTARSLPAGRSRAWAASPVMVTLGLLIFFGGSLVALNVAMKREPRAPVEPAVRPSTPVSSSGPAGLASPTPPLAAAPAPLLGAPAPASVPGSLAPDSGGSPAPTTPTAVAAPPAAAVAAPRAAGAPSADASVPGAALHRLVAKTSEPTWLRVQTDEGRVIEELLPAGATREWTTSRRFVLTIGNAGGIQLELNGKALPPLGARGQVIQRLELPQEQPVSGS
jgi:cytoskeleton protein RodZ